MPDNRNYHIFKLLESQYKASDLTDHYANTTKDSLRILPKEKRRYVMYLRKSTDDEAKRELAKQERNYSEYQILQRDDPVTYKTP